MISLCIITVINKHSLHKTKKQKGPYACLTNSKIHKKLVNSIPLCKQPRKESSTPKTVSSNNQN